MSSAQASVHDGAAAQNWQWSRLVVAAWRVAPLSSGRNGSLIGSRPVIESAPSVVPWYAVCAGDDLVALGLAA